MSQNAAHSETVGGQRRDTPWPPRQAPDNMPIEQVHGILSVPCLGAGLIQKKKEIPAGISYALKHSGGAGPPLSVIPTLALTKSGNSGHGDPADSQPASSKPPVLVSSVFLILFLCRASVKSTRQRRAKCSIRTKAVWNQSSSGQNMLVSNSA